MMKAWLVRNKYEFCATVVFAETRGKAKAMALHTEICEYADFIDIEAYRMPKLDMHYKDGKSELDWFIAEDRIVLVKDAGFVCDGDYWEREDCDTCPANEFCARYQDCLAEEGGGEA